MVMVTFKYFTHLMTSDIRLSVCQFVDCQKSSSSNPIGKFNKKDIVWLFIKQSLKVAVKIK